ncbi:MAG: ABC transporter permease [Candidatus Bipolaricaulota bacterium]|nr:ABC transporter permease [Candidatus Bipolaricaulota bacterium]
MIAKPVREGSPWRGLWAVVAKEMADHLTSVRMGILEVIVLLTAAVTLYMALQNLPSGTSDFLFLRLFTISQDPLPAFVGFLGVLVPLIAIVLGFDSINGEFNRRTLSRVLAQPIYRDALLLGKFLAGLFTLALVLTAIWLMIIGLGIFRLGVPPTGEEVARGLLFLLATIAYGGIWLGLAMVFSVRFRQPATAALASISVWIFFSVFWGMLVGLIAQGLGRGIAGQIQLELFLARLSPNTLYAESILAILNPEVRALGPLLLVQFLQLQHWGVRSPLPLSQSLLLVWPQLTGLIAGTIVLFAIGYVLFQRQEIRA